MSVIKSPEEIEILKRGGKILSSVLRELREKCVSGITTAELDRLAQKQIREAGGRPSFLGYSPSPSKSGYPAAVCVSINEEVVHGIPSDDRVIRDGDIVSMDIGLWYEDLCTDMATTVMAGRVNPKIMDLVLSTREALVRGLGAVREGAMVGDIGAAIEDFIKPKGYGIVRDLVGHGVGHAVHEEPPIPNFRDPRSPRVELKTGMVIAIEPMISIGDWRIRQLGDGWTIVTADGSPSAHFEVTVAVTEDGYDLITPWPDE
jgi:methionyl aminopeptidase